MKLTKKAFIVSAMILVLALLVVSTSMAESVKLTFWSWRTEDVEAYEKFFSEFSKTHPNIEIEFIPYRNTEYNTILATALQGGAGPDIIHLRTYGGMEPLAQAGYLSPLDDKIEALQDFRSDVLLGATLRSDGRVYGVPIVEQTVLVLYNKAIFRELGVEEPQTWDEFIAIAEKAKAAGYVPFANGSKEGWTLETFFGAVAPTYYGGGTFFDEVVSGKVNFTDPRFKTAIEKMLELRPYLPDDYVGVGYTDMQMMFAQEMAAMFLAGSYEFGTMAQMNPDLEIGVFIVPNTTAEQNKYFSMYVDASYGMNANTEHPEEVLAFLKWAATKEFGTLYANTLQVLSVVPGIEISDPLLQEIVSMLGEHATSYLMLTAFRYGTPSGSTLLQNELQGVFSDTITLDQAITNIQTGLESWYEPFNN
ncbi:MAG: extracellular solute-binding protein [Firmicutes bacterium]|nr:extracellular solute-binding protein [Bacillota bacterium]